MSVANPQVQKAVDEAWLRAELRSDHAGETGAVFIYRGVLAVTRDPDLHTFAEAHLETEMQHLEIVGEMLACDDQSRLLCLWRVAGFLTGAVPALIGARTVFHTIDAVETFVERHYRAQVEVLSAVGESEKAALLASMMADEVLHRDEARSKAGHAPGLATRLWQGAVGMGSAAAVAVARRI